MPLHFNTLADLLGHDCDTIIDVRSPAEFAADHIPGAINLPVLSNDERAEVGTIYKQVSPFMGRKIGAAKVFRNAADHVAGPLADKDGSWRPLVYCWRGGQRSGAFAWMLREIGWRSETITGGYRSFRRLVHDALYEQSLPYRLVLIDGNTGTAKTDLLMHLVKIGLQAVDLEGLSNHRGSLLGDLGPQPSQKAFETQLACALARFDPEKPVFLEAESSKIGDRILSPSLWSAMKTAPRIVIEAPIKARAQYLTKAYADILAQPDALKGKLHHLIPYRGKAVVDQWFALIDAGDKEALTQALMQDHYDPAYQKSRVTRASPVIARYQLADLTPTDLQALALQIAQDHSG